MSPRFGTSSRTRELARCALLLLARHEDRDRGLCLKNRTRYLGIVVMIEEYQNVDGSAAGEAKIGGSRPIKDPVLTMSTRPYSTNCPWSFFTVDTFVVDGLL